MTIDELNVLITAQTKEFDKSIKSVNKRIDDMSKQTEKATSRISGMFKKVGAVALAAFSASAIISFGKQAVELASNVQEVQNVVDTAFGSMSGMVEDFASTAIEQFGMSELTAKKTASTYMAMSKGLGLADEAAAQMAISVAGLTGDVASFYNVSQEVADTALKSIWTGETESLKQFGVVMTQANLQQYAYQQGIKKTISEMTQAEQVQLRYMYVTDQLSLAQGDFVKTSGSWANQTRVLSERWKEFMTIIGNGLIKVLTPVVEFLNTALQQLISFADSVGQVLTNTFGGQAAAQSEVAASTQTAAIAQGELAANTEKAGKAAKGALAGFDMLNVLTDTSEDSDEAIAFDAGSTVTPTSGADTTAMKETAGVMDGLVSKITKASQKIQIALSPSFDAWGTAFASLQGPATSAFQTITSSTTGLWNETLLPFGEYLTFEFVPGIANGFSENIAPIFAEVMPVAISEFAKDWEWACGEIDRITDDILYPAFGFVETASNDVFSGIKTAWDEHGTGILTGFQTFKEKLREIWDTVYTNVIKPVIDRIGGTISWLWDQHLKPLWDKLTDFFGSVTEFILALWNNVLAPVVDFVVKVVGPLVSHVVGSIGDVVGTVIGVIADVIGGILSSLSGLLDFLTGVFTGNWEKAWGGIQKFFKGIWDGIWGIVKGIVNLIIDGLNTLWGAVYSVVSGIVNGIGGIAEVIGDLFGQDWGFSMPAEPPLIPKLAAGGLAYGPTLAMIGEGRHREAVLPLSSGVYSELARGIDQQSNSGRVEGAIYEAAQMILDGIRDMKPIVTIDGKPVARIMYPYYRSEAKRRGSTPVEVI